MWPFSRRAKAPPAAGELPHVAVPPAPARRPLVSDAALGSAALRGDPPPYFAAPSFPPGVGPNASRKTGSTMALDGDMDAYNSWANGGALNAFGEEGLTFLGYPYLSLLAQRPEYRVICETIADEMTRKWIRFISKDEEDKKTDRIKELQEEFERLNVREIFARVAQQDGYFGRGHIYVDTGDTDNPDELLQPLGSGWDEVSKIKMKGKKIQALRTVEAVWCYPQDYNSFNPLKANWYAPNIWYAQATRVHRTRLLTFVGREVPDLLKPTYSFGGLSLSQMVKPYVDNWLETRQSVNDAISAFSIFNLGTNLAESMQADGDQLFKRAQFFNMVRDNRGLMMTDKDSEDLKNVSMPLGSLDLLQAQAQEHMSAVSHIPTVKLLGIQPAGLNADSEGVMRSFYDYIKSYQEHFMRDKLHGVLGLVMIQLWGDVDESIDFEFEPLWAMDEKQIADIEKSKVDGDVALIDRGVLHPEEVRQRLASDEFSGYSSIDVDDVPDLEEEELGGLEPQGGRPDPAAVELEEKQADVPVGKSPAKDSRLANDDEQWEENKHPRAKNGQFGSGGGGSSSHAAGVQKLGFTESHKNETAGTTTFKKGESKLTMFDKEGTWVLSSPGHMSKTGDNVAALEALLGGDPAKWQAAGVKNWTGPDMHADPANKYADLPPAKQTLAKIAAVRPQPTGNQSQAINAYKGSGYGHINDTLRHSGKHTPLTSEMHAWLEKAQLPEDVTLWRGVKSDYAKILKSILDDGTIFRDRGFISTTTDDDFAKNWKSNGGAGQLLMRIDAKKGQKGAAIRSADHADGESEVVLQSDSRLKVISFDWEAGTVHCELVQPEDRMEKPEKAKQSPAASAPVIPISSTGGESTAGAVGGEYKKNPTKYKIEVVSKKNPKKAGSAGNAAFANYSTGMTVQDFVNKMGSKGAAFPHLDWDLKKGFVKLTQ